jgi:chromate transporter
MSRAFVFAAPPTVKLFLRIRRAPDTTKSMNPQPPTFSEAFRFWLKLGFISFGGPAGQIAIMHEELVERRRWLSEERFLHAMNYCMLLPGPEAQQLATYAGWLLHGTWGGIVAGSLFVLPSALILWALSWAYVSFGTLPWMAAILYGLKPAVLAIVAAALVRIGARVLKNPAMWTLAALAFAGLFLANLPFPLVVFGAGLAGYFGGRIRPDLFIVLKTHGAATAAAGGAPPSFARAVKVLAIGLTLWWTPIFAAGAWHGWDGTLFREGLFFSKAAMVTFGGAYAVLPYVSQQAVENYGWLAPGQMLDGLGLAETTPGPLIMVLQFTGFLGGWNHPGPLTPLTAATLGAGITTWATFLPCFIWIFLGAPYVERLREQPRLTAALSAITAAIVGVILNLAVWFGWHVLRPAPGHFDVFAAVIATVAFAGIIRWKWNVIAVVGGCAFVGWVALFAAQ